MESCFSGEPVRSVSPDTQSAERAIHQPDRMLRPFREATFLHGAADSLGIVVGGV
ncbi:hypothetical protein PLACP1_23730 [Planifilum fimeticola]